MLFFWGGNARLSLLPRLVKLCCSLRGLDTTPDDRVSSLSPALVGTLGHLAAHGHRLASIHEFLLPAAMDACPELFRPEEMRSRVVAAGEGACDGYGDSGRGDGVATAMLTQAAAAEEEATGTPKVPVSNASL